MNDKLRNMIRHAWFAPPGGLPAPADGEADLLFNAICAELPANTDGLSEEEDALAEIGNAIGSLIRDLERVSNALLSV